MLNIINSILLCYFVPLIVAYFGAKLYHTFNDLGEYDRPGLLTVIMIVCPGVNIFGAILFGFIGIIEFLGNGVDWARKKGDRTIGERFLKMKKENDR